MMRATENRQATKVPGRSATRRRSASRAGTAQAALAVCFLTALVLTGCTAPAATLTQRDTAAPAGSPTPAGSAATGTTQPSSTEPTTAQAGTSSVTEGPATAVAKQTVADALGRLAAGTPKPATAQVTEALTGAGIDPAALEVSASRTPTGLEADAIEAAVLQGEDCVFGHIRDGNVTVTILPVLATGKCFVGTGT